MADEEISLSSTKKKKTTFFQKILILMLSGVLTVTFGVVLIMLDFIQMINIREKLPPNIRQNPIVQDYIKKVELAHMSEEQRLKFWLHEQNEEYEKQQAELKKREYEIEEKLKNLIEIEKKMEEIEVELEKKENVLTQTQEELDNLEQRKQNINEGIKIEQIDDLLKKEKLTQLAGIYERMDPEIAGQTFNEMDTDLAIEIIMMMKDNKAALIMNNINPDKVTEIAEKLKTKNAWRQ